jgi:hypothetical protein
MYSTIWKPGVRGLYRYKLRILYRQEVSNGFQETGVAGGFRLDAIKHMDSLFLCNFVGNLDWMERHELMRYFSFAIRGRCSGGRTSLQLVNTGCQGPCHLYVLLINLLNPIDAAQLF